MPSITKTYARDIQAGLTVSLVALPLAIAFGQSSGLGAASGLITAIIAGFVAAVFGGSRFQVSGPTGAMTVVLIPIFDRFGATGVLFVGLIAGVLVLAAGFLRIGQLVHRLPTAIIEGFTAGIALVIALGQLPDALGIKPPKGVTTIESASEVFADFIRQPNWLPLVFAASTAILVYSLGRHFRRFPSAIIVILLATLINNVGQLGLSTVPKVDQVVRAPNAGFVSVEFSRLGELVIPALLVAALAALESLLSAKVADRLKGDGTLHNSNRELIGQGLANIAVPFFGGVPATAALARTVVNVRAGAETKWAAALHAAFLAIFVLGFAKYISLIPLPALAGVLLATAAGMIRMTELLQLARRSYLDAISLVITFGLTVFTDLATALVVGAIIWFALRKTRLAAELPSVSETETFGD